MGRHVESVGVVRGDRLVSANDLERAAFSPRRIVGVDQIVHSAGVVGVPCVDFEKERCGPLGVRQRDLPGRRDRQVSQGIKRRCLGVRRKGFVDPLHRLFPATNALPVVG